MKFDALLGASYTLFSSKAEIQKSVNTVRQRVETDQGMGPFALMRTPGLSCVFQPSGGNGRFRGNGIELNDNVVFVINTTAYRLSGPATIAQTYAAAISSDGKPVRFAASGNSALFVSNGVLYRADATTVTTPASGLGVVFVDVIYISTYYVGVTSTTQFYWSTDDGVTWDPANVQTAEASPNGLLAAIVHYETLFLVGNRVTQAFIVGPDPTKPFVPQGSGVIPFGTEAGPSLQALGEYRYWLGRNRDGTGVVYRSHGYGVERISNLALENRIREYERDFGVSDAFASPYRMMGQDFYRLVFPAADASWELNATVSIATGIPEWSEVAWWDWAHGAFHRHRANLILSAFGTILAGDSTNGWLYRLSPDTYHDFGFPLKWLRRAPHLVEDGHRILSDRLALGMEVGVGLNAPLWLHTYDRDRTTFVANLATQVGLGNVTAAQQTVVQTIYDILPYTPLNPYPAPATMTTLGFVEWGRDPSIQLEYSNDGGLGFANPLARKLGRSGETRTRVFWDRLGMARDRVYQLSGEDPVKLAIATAWLDAEALMS